MTFSFHIHYIVVVVADAGVVGGAVIFVVVAKSAPSIDSSQIILQIFYMRKYLVWQ